MALGAKPAHVVSLILREEAGTALAGIAVGALCALALTRAIQALLFGVSASDPLTLLFVAALLAVVAGLASFVPARRATRIDPLVALRTSEGSRVGCSGMSRITSQNSRFGVKTPAGCWQEGPRPQEATARA